MKKKLFTYGHWKREEVAVTDLSLDAENIRLEVKDKSQDALITDLFINEKAMQVLKSIVENGLFPDEIPITIKENGRHVTIEGNRRVAALKVMLNPALLGTQKAHVVKILRNIDPIKKIEVLVAPNRSEANKLLANKHTKVTRKPWKPLRQAYFYHAQLEKGKTIEDLKRDYPNVDVTKFIKMWEIHKIARSLQYTSEATAKKIYDQRNFPVSTVERLYDDKDFREFLGFDFTKEGLLKIKSQKTDFENVFKRIFVDAIDGVIDTRTLGKEKARKKYFQNLQKPRKAQAEITSEAFKAPKQARLSLGKPKLDVSGIDFRLPYPAVKRMYMELERISIDDSKGFPNAAHDLLRSFLECSLKAFFELHKINVKKTGEFTFLKDALNTFLQDGKVKNLAGGRYSALKSLVEKVRQDKGPGNMREYTAHFMNQLNHSHYFFSDNKSVETGWDHLKPIFLFILGAVPDDKN